MVIYGSKELHENQLDVLDTGTLQNSIQNLRFPGLIQRNSSVSLKSEGIEGWGGIFAGFFRGYLETLSC